MGNTGSIILLICIVIGLTFLFYLFGTSLLQIKSLISIFSYIILVSLAIRITRNKTKAKKFWYSLILFSIPSIAIILLKMNSDGQGIFTIINFVIAFILANIIALAPISTKK